MSSSSRGSQLLGSEGGFVEDGWGFGVRIFSGAGRCFVAGMCDAVAAVMGAAGGGWGGGRAKRRAVMMSIVNISSLSARVVEIRLDFWQSGWRSRTCHFKDLGCVGGKPK